MFALYAAGGRNRIQVNTMTETLPVYHADLAGLATERRRAMTLRRAQRRGRGRGRAIAPRG
jgi:hypothetical protein